MKATPAPEHDSLQEERISRYGRLLAVVTLMVGIGIRLLQYLHCRSLWLDEAFLTRNITTRNTLELLQPLDFNQGAPVLFLILTDLLTKLLGTSEFVLRLLPLLASTGALVLFYLLARIYLKPVFLVLAVALISFSPELIYYAQEFKQYSMDVLAALASFYAFSLYLKHGGMRYLLLLGLIGVVSLFLSHPSVFILFCIAVSLLFLMRKSDDVSVRTATLGVCSLWTIGFLLNYFFFIHSLTQAEKIVGFWKHGFMPFPTSIQALVEIKFLLTAFLKYAGFEAVWQLVVFVILFAVSVVAVLRTRDCLLLNFLALFPLMVVASLLDKYPFSARLLLFLMPICYFFVSYGLQQLLQKTPAYVGIIAALIVGQPFLVSGYVNSLYPITVEELRPLMELLDEQRSEEDLVYIYYAAVYAAVYYNEDLVLAGEGVILEEDHRLHPDRYAEAFTALDGYDRIWLLFSHVHANEEALITSYVNGELVFVKELDGASLYLYDLP